MAMVLDISVWRDLSHCNSGIPEHLTAAPHCHLEPAFTGDYPYWISQLADCNHSSAQTKNTQFCIMERFTTFKHNDLSYPNLVTAFAHLAILRFFYMDGWSGKKSSLKKSEACMRS